MTADRTPLSESDVAAAADGRRYVLRLLGHLDQRWSAWFAGFSITHEADGTTSVTGVVTDQSELHGLLERIRDLGATLLSVLPADTSAAPAVTPSSAQSQNPIPGDRS